MEDKWIDSIKDKMGEYEVIPPDGLLESVQAAVKARRKKKRLLFPSIAASVALLCGLSMVLIPDRIDNSRSLASNVDDGNTHNGFLGEEEEMRIIQDTILPCYKHSVRGAVAALLSETSRSNALVMIRPIHDEVNTNSNEIEDEHNDYSDKEAENQNEAVSSNLHEESTHRDADISTRSEDSKLSAGVSASANGLGGVLNDGDISGQYPQRASYMPSTRMGGGVLDDIHANEVPEPRFIELFDHKLPVRFTVDFSWPVYHNLSVGTGISYSYLRSDIRYGYSDAPLSKAVQNLHYIGIPVSLRYVPWSFSRFDAYASAGVMVEKCLGGGINEEDPSAGRYSYEGCDDRPFQFSFNAAVGLQYSLSSHCSVFIEPGMGIYLKNGSRLRTIYSERPLTFNVNVGLRFGQF